MSRRVISAVLSLRDQNFRSGLRAANRQTSEFGRYVQQAQNKATNFGRSVSQAFKTVGVAAGALAGSAVAGLGAAVANQVVQAEDAFSKLSAQTGAFGAELTEYKDIAKDVFTNGFSESLGEASTAVGKFANMFPDLEFGNLADVTSGSFTIAKTFDQEATEVGRSVKALLTNFDELSGTDATDLITTMFRETGDYANDLLDTISEYSGNFKDIGMGGEQFANMLIKGADAGAWNLDKVGDAVKEFTLLSTDGSKKTAESFQAIGLNADEMAAKMMEGGESANQAYMATIAGLAGMDSEVERNRTGIALFGTQWEDLRKDVVMAMTDSTDALGDYRGATEDAADALTKGPVARIRSSWRKLLTDLASGSEDGAGKSFLDSIASAAEDAVPVVLDLADKAVDFAVTIKNNWGPIKETIVGITTAVVVFKGAMWGLTIIKTVTGFVKAYRTALVAGTAAQAVFSAVASANPLGLVALAIAAVVSGAVLLYRNWDTVTAKTKEVWSSIGGLEGAISLVLGPLGFLINAAVDLARNWDSTKSVWENVWGSIQRSAANSVNAVIGSINSMIETINNLPGVNIPVIAKVSWGNVDQSKVSTGDFRKIEGRYAVGSNNITHDQVAEIHKGEMIIPALQAQRVRAAGGTINNIDKLVSGEKSKNTTSVSNTSTSNKSAQFGNINIYAQGTTPQQVVEYIVPQLKAILKMV